VRGEPLVEEGRLRGRREVERARAQLRAELAADAPSRLARLTQVSLLEPWLSEIWALEPDEAGTPSGRSSLTG